MKIAIGAQSWAYGPAGKANAIGHELKKLNVETLLVGSGTSFEMCKRSGYFSSFKTISNPKEWEFIGKVDGIVSVMDPVLALLAKKRNLPLIYIDSMSWFWNWKSPQAIPDVTTGKNFLEAYSNLKQMQPDTQQLVAHTLADKILAQGNPQTTTFTKQKAKNVGAIIDLNFKKKSKRDILIISLSGGISPATDLKTMVNYANITLDLLSNSLIKWPGANRYLLTGSPEVIKALKSVPSFIEKKALSHPDFLTKLNESVAVIVPCGFTTIFEALAYDTPLAFLPENHNGHVYEYLTITQSVKKNKGKIFPEILFTLSESSLDKIRSIEDSMSLINMYTSKYAHSKTFQEACKKKVANWPKLFRKREYILAKQKKYIKNFIPEFNGAENAAKTIVNTFRHE